MKIYIGSDHGGFYLKEKIEAYLSKRGIEWEDVGDKELDPHDDFPQFAQMAATKLLGEDEKTDPRAILICTGGQGMAMAANRFRGIRAAVIWDSFEARECRNDNNSNVLLAGSRRRCGWRRPCSLERYHRYMAGDTFRWSGTVCSS